jgi:hypothetical protein
MTELMLTASVGSTLPVSLNFRSSFPFEEPIAVSFSNTFDDHQKTRWIISNQCGPLFVSQAEPTVVVQRQVGVDCRDLISVPWQGLVYVLPRGFDHMLFLLCLYLAVHT